MKMFEAKLPDVQEPLVESSKLAFNWAKSLCNGCSSYHGSWQTLRLLGVMNSMCSDDDFILPRLDAEISGTSARILISGAADYALLARVAAISNPYTPRPEITVIDLCRTPLELNRWYASLVGMDVELLCEDILSIRKPRQFNLICTHSFLSFFNPNQRKDLVKAWWEALVPGGAILTAQRARTGEVSLRQKFTQGQITGFGWRAYRLAEEQYEKLQIEPEFARNIALDYASNWSTFKVCGSEYLRQLFIEQGFVLEHFAKPGSEQLEKDLPSTPNKNSDHRWRILARKPLLQSN